MAVRPRNRFEVFKRDGFQCQYCGRRVPDVTLEVDHILPKAEGGKDGRDNLITACVDCNRGKGAVLLKDGEPRPDYAGRVAEMGERQKQVKAYYAHEAAITAALEEQVDEVLQYWTSSLGNGDAPRRSLRRFVKLLGPNQVKEAMDIAEGKTGGRTQASFEYFCGICWKWVRGANGHTGR